MSKESWLKAEELFIEQFIEKNGREPTEEEIQKEAERAYANFVSSLDEAYERGRE